MIIFNHKAGVVNKNAAFFKAFAEMCDGKITGFLLCSLNTGNESTIMNNNNKNNNNHNRKIYPI
jgi:hypothetical protein